MDNEDWDEPTIEYVDYKKLIETKKSSNVIVFHFKKYR